MEKIATDIATFEKVIGEANGTDEPVMARTAVVRTAVVRTAAVSAAGAGQGRARYHAAVETTAVRSKAGAGQGDGHVTMLPPRRRQYGARLALARGAGTLPRCRRDGGSTEETAPAAETAAVRRRRRRYGIGQYGARSDFSEAN